MSHLSDKKKQSMAWIIKEVMKTKHQSKQLGVGRLPAPNGSSLGRGWAYDRSQETVSGGRLLH